MKQFAITIAAILGAAAISSPLSASVITQTFSGTFPTVISGTLPNQASYLLETVTLPANSSLTVTSTSYATGGFETNIELFNSAGNFIMAGIPFGTAPVSTGIIGDSQLTASHLSGVYTIALTDFLLGQSLTATNLSAGFTVDYGSGTTFVDSNGNSRTGAYSLNLAVSSPAATAPEPASFLFAAPLLAGLAWRARKRSQVS